MFGVAKIKVKLKRNGSFYEAGTDFTIKQGEIKEVLYTYTIQQAIKDGILVQVINQ